MGYLGVLDQNLTTSSTPSFAGMTFSGNVNLGNNRITNLSDPTGNGDAATKSYVDLNASGLTPKDAVRVATTANLSATYADVDATADGVGDTLTATANGAISVDSVSLSATNRVLVKDQTNPQENGIYTVTTVGDGSTAFVLTRSTDFDEVADITNGTSVFVSEGTVNAATTWVKTTGTVTNISDDDIEFSQFSGAAVVNAGSGLSKTGNTLDVETSSLLQINGSNQVDLVVPVAISSGGTGATSFTTASRIVATNSSNNGLESTALDPTAVVTLTGSETLTNKTLDSATNTVRATSFATTGSPVVVSGSDPPVSGALLQATSATTAEWVAQAAAQIEEDLFFVGTSYTENNTFFNTLGACLTYINDNRTPSQANPVMVLVQLGTYTETAPLTIPSWVTVRGRGSYLNSSTFVPSDPDAATVFDLSSNSNIADLVVKNCNNIGIRASSAILANIFNVVVEDCGTGIEAVGTGAANSAVVVMERSTVFSRSAALGTGMKCSNGGFISANSSRATGFFSSITIAFHATGANSKMELIGCRTQNATRAYLVENGTVGNKAIMICQSCLVVNTVTSALEVGANSLMRAFGCEIRNAGSSSDDLVTTAASAEFVGSGNIIDANRLNLNADSDVVSLDISTFAGDKGIRVQGELSVGSHLRGSETVMGGGDSHVIGMNVLQTDDDATFTAITDNVNAAGDGNSNALFASTAVGERCYIGGTDAQFPGLALIVDTGISPAGGAVVTSNASTYSVAYSLTWEYWNGSTWVEFRIMVTDRSAPYLPRRQEAFDVGNSQIRFGVRVSDDVSMRANWTTTAVNSITAYWIRITINTILTTVPVLQQVKLHTDRVEVNSDGFTEFFGHARYGKRLPFDMGFIEAANNSPGNQDIYIGDQLGVGRVENNFVPGTIDRLAFMTRLPPDIDTSYPLTLNWIFKGDAGGSGNVLWTVRYAWTQDESEDANAISDIFNTTGDAPGSAPNQQTTTSTVAVTATNKQFTTFVQLNISDMVPIKDNDVQGDVLWISIERTGTSGSDTFNTDVNIVQISPQYVSWCNGSYVE